MTEDIRETDPGELEAEIARTCGVLNAATGHLVSLIARVLESGSWQVSGIIGCTTSVIWE